MKKILFMFLIMFVFSNAKAYCSSEETSRLSRMINNININYEYNYDSNNFVVTFSNITSDFIVTYMNEGNDYVSYDELEFDNVLSGNHRFKIYSKKCNSISIIRDVTLPHYNEFFNSSECKNIQDYSYCNKWLPNEISYDIFKEKVDKYKETINKPTEQEEIMSKKSVLDIIADIIKEFYVRYYIVLLPMIILALCAIIYLKDKIDQIL